MESAEKFWEKVTPIGENRGPDGLLERISPELIRKISEINREGQSIGVGQTAEVFVSTTDSTICYKVMKAEPEKFCVTAETEAIFMSKAGKMAREATVPKPYYSLEAPGGISVLVMEKIDGDTLGEIIEKDLPLPEGFNLNRFSDNLKRFFERLNEGNIHHQDIHTGNIMIDRTTGAAVVIDFGSSDERIGGDRQSVLVERGRQRFISSDPDQLRATLLELKKHIYKKRHG